MVFKQGRYLINISQTVYHKLFICECCCHVFSCDYWVWLVFSILIFILSQCTIIGRGNPQRLDSAGLTKRVAFTYEQVTVLQTRVRLFSGSLHLKVVLKCQGTQCQICAQRLIGCQTWLPPNFEFFGPCWSLTWLLGPETPCSSGRLFCLRRDLGSSVFSAQVLLSLMYNFQLEVNGRCRSLPVLAFASNSVSGRAYLSDQMVHTCSALCICIIIQTYGMIMPHGMLRTTLLIQQLLQSQSLSEL